MLLIEAVTQHNKINKRDLHAFTTLHSNHVLTCNTEFSVFGKDFKRILNQELTINLFAWKTKQIWEDLLWIKTKYA